MPTASHRRRANVLGVAVDALDLEGALERVCKVLESDERGYVCAVGVHGVLTALRDKRMARALGDASLVIPDGTPTVWVGRLQRCAQMGHVPGPKLMKEIFRREEFAHLTHYLYGGKEGVADQLAGNLAMKFPHARIVGTHTPPFRALTPAEEAALIEEIEALKPDIFWVGISTPKQEMFMRRMVGHLNTRLMFGVGAAFDFHTGRIRDCAPWIKAAGFQWLHRLVQDPKRLWRRNLSNSTFLWHITLQLSGLKTFPLTASSRDHNAVAEGRGDSAQFQPSSAINM
jgi:N-acetylglucosaminyldiphosphoundecaprenol N-acetyl-beta-D-mannosaminyltransferase